MKNLPFQHVVLFGHIVFSGTVKRRNLNGFGRHGYGLDKIGNHGITGLVIFHDGVFQIIPRL